MDVRLPDTSLDARVQDVLWRLAPGSVHRRLRRWRPARVAGQAFRIPMLGGRQLSLEALQLRWRRELLDGMMPKDGGHVIDAGARLGELLIDLQCSAPGSHYVGFEPCVARAAYLVELIRQNSIEGSQVVPAALTARSGVVTSPAGSASQLGAGLAFDDIRQSVAPGPVRLVNLRVGGAEAAVLAGMRATLTSDRPMLLCEVRFAQSAQAADEERARKEALQLLLAEQCYVILQLVINVNGDIVGGARLPEFPLAVESAAQRFQREYLIVPREELDRLKRHLY